MRDDILTVMWKERKGLFRYRGSRARFLLTLLSPLFLAVWAPLEEGREWVNGPSPVLLAAIVPIILVGITIPDSFAGERERHTLGTLMASRLPDRAILFGKVAVSVIFAWGVALIFLLAGLVTANVAHREGELILFTPTIALAALALSFLMATLSTGAGVLISLRSATVQEATQTLMAIFLVPPMFMMMAMLVFRDQIQDLLGGLSGEQLFLIIMVVMTALDLLVFAVVMSRFQRSRLYLD